MEFDAYNTRANSTREFLRQQIRDEARVCDVKVRVGNWEKMFHWCVLITSPFFRCLYDNKIYVSKGSIDIVEVTFGSQHIVASAIMFLYGKKIKINKRNISEMLDIAEFLLLPNLKSACISWMNRCEIAFNNCIDILMLASLYDIFLPNCEKFIEGHLSVLLELDEMLQLTKDSVKRLFTDPKLSYVTVDQKYHFLKKWVHHRKSRFDDCNEMFSLLDFTDISGPLLDEMKADSFTKCLTETSCLSKSMKSNENKRRVFISYSNYSLNCYDIGRNQVFRIEMQKGENSVTSYSSLKGNKGRDFSDLYFIKNSYGNTDVVVIDVEKDTDKKTSVVTLDDPLVHFSNYQKCVISTDSFLAYSHHNIPIKPSTGADAEVQIAPSLFMMSMSPNYFDRMIAQQTIHKELRGKLQTVTTLYKGTLFEGPDGSTIAIPILSLKAKIDKFATDDNECVAMLSIETKLLYLFHSSCNTLDHISVDEIQILHQGFSLVSCSNGFVIYDNTYAVSIMRIQGACLNVKYLVKTNVLEEANYSTSYEYKLIANTWFRKEYHGNVGFTFSYIRHEKLICNGGDWTFLSLTKEGRTKLLSDFDRELFMISVPKHKLRCHLECPHCEAIKYEGYRRASKRALGQQASSSSSSSSSSSYYDSSDEGKRSRFSDFFDYDSD